MAEKRVFANGQRFFSSIAEVYENLKANQAVVIYHSNSHLTNQGEPLIFSDHKDNQVLRSNLEEAKKIDSGAFIAFKGA